MIIITGGAGFIGSAALRRLNELGRNDIIVVDHLGHEDKWRNLVKADYADYLDRQTFMDMVRKDALRWNPEAVIHLGACSSTTETDANFLMENNFHYSRDLCLFALQKGARFINASSAATYGDGSLGFSDNPALIPKLRPLNMYGYSKQLFDMWLIRENLLDQVASLKFFNVYGPNEYHKGSMKSVACKIFSEISQTGQATLFASNNPAIADGEQKRDFVYVKDCANLICWLALERRDLNGVRNVGTGQAATFNQLARAMFAAMKREPVINYIPTPGAISSKYQNYTQADMGWLGREACPCRFRDIAAGIADYAANYLAKEDRYL